MINGVLDMERDVISYLTRVEDPNIKISRVDPQRAILLFILCEETNLLLTLLLIWGQLFEPLGILLVKVFVVFPCTQAILTQLLFRSLLFPLRFSTLLNALHLCYIFALYTASYLTTLDILWVSFLCSGIFVHLVIFSCWFVAEMSLK